MSPEARNILKEIVRELLKVVELPETFSEFLYKSAAEKNDYGKWIVYLDGEKQEGAIDLDFTGNTAYEVQEEAWTWFNSIIEECKNT